MLVNSTREQYYDLCSKARYHMERYYNDDAPEISDFEFDTLKSEIAEIEKLHPEWITSSSPTQFVAKREAKNGLSEVKHITPMLSIQDVFSEEEVKDWLAKTNAKEYTVEQKIDGLSMTLRYHEGKLIQAETRGDGFVGEDVTANAKMITGVPLIIPEERDLEVRGEVYISTKAFEEANLLQEKRGQKLFANARNCAAGSLRILDANVTKQRNLNFFAFSVQSGPKEFVELQSMGMDYLKQMGFSPVSGKTCRTEEEVLDAIKEIGEKREGLAYGIDGAVIKINSKEMQKNFPVGTGLKYSAGMIAYKYPSEEKEAIIRMIELTVGRTGRINPTAVFSDESQKPLQLCGTSVTRATLHNQDYIDELGIDVGARVLVYKSGDIIPKIKKVISGTGKTYKIPEYCPACGAKLIREPGTADIICPNENCEPKAINKIIHFASKPCMNIKGLGESSIETLWKAGYLRNITDIYVLKNHRDELIEKGILGKEKGTDNVLDAIEASKKQSANRVLAGLGIPLIGHTAAKIIMEHYEKIEDLMDASVSDLMRIEGVGMEMAEFIYNYFASFDNNLLFLMLASYGVNTIAEKKNTGNGLLAGETFCITGTLSAPRSEFEDKIISNGGKVTGSVSKKTTYLLAGEKAGSKLEKAQTLGVKVLTEAEFNNMLK